MIKYKNFEIGSGENCYNVYDKAKNIVDHFNFLQDAINFIDRQDKLKRFEITTNKGTVTLMYSDIREVLEETIEIIDEMGHDITFMNIKELS